ncbi:MAG: hypothetical protein ABI548_06215 [Polyangiaceae bacterium]
MARRLSSAVFALGLAGAVAACTIAACSSGGGTPASPSAGAGNASPSGSAGSATATGGSAGLSAGNAGAGNAGAGAGNAGAGNAGGTSGSASGGGNSSGGVSGSGTAGAATAGAAQGGSAGAAGDLAAAAVLNHYQLLDPCQSSYKAVATPGDVCPQDTAVKNQKIQLQFGGDASVTYDVTLHVRGVMEGYWYSGGMLDTKSNRFYTGGVPTIGGFTSACKNKTSELPFALPAEITPTDNCWNGFNMFALVVSAPSQHYFLNYTADKDGDRQPHAVYSNDYTVTIPIQGQAKLEFYIIGSDEHECYNFNGLISGVTTMPSPYVGDFVQFDVTSVTRAQ